MKAILVVVVLCMGVACVALDDGHGNACEFTREDVVLKAGVYFDDNDDNLISRNEIEKYWNLLLKPVEKMYTSVAPWVETVDVIMAHCDKDGDGAISLEDFRNKDHCLETCDKLKLMNEKIFQRALERIPEDDRDYYERRASRKKRLLDFYKQKNGFDTFD